MVKLMGVQVQREGVQVQRGDEALARARRLIGETGGRLFLGRGHCHSRTDIDRVELEYPVELA